MSFSSLGSVFFNNVGFIPPTPTLNKKYGHTSQPKNGSFKDRTANAQSDLSGVSPVMTGPATRLGDSDGLGLGQGPSLCEDGGIHPTGRGTDPTR